MSKSDQWLAGRPSALELAPRLWPEHNAQAGARRAATQVKRVNRLLLLHCAPSRVESCWCIGGRADGQRPNFSIGSAQKHSSLLSGGRRKS